jgi:PAS domain-containing protein
MDDARYRSLFEASPQPMWVYDIETLAFLAVNETAVREYGYTKSEFLAIIGPGFGGTAGAMDRRSTSRSPRTRSPSTGGARGW